MKRPVTVSDAALFTDLYELTMGQAYRAEQMDGWATFSLFVRKLPEERNYLLACGLPGSAEWIDLLGPSWFWCSCSRQEETKMMRGSG